MDAFHQLTNPDGPRCTVRQTMVTPNAVVSCLTTAPGLTLSPTSVLIDEKSGNQSLC